MRRLAWIVSESGILVIGLGLVTAGCSMAWLPLGPIVLGGLLLGGLTWTRLRTVPVKETKQDE